MADQGKKKQNRVRRDDKVRVLAGEHRNAEGKVTRILAENNRVEVEIDGLAEDRMIVKHQKRSTEFPNGTRLHLNPTIHISNVMKLGRWNDRPRRQLK
jgi:large subunit ribosomal protein L24